MEEGKKVKSVDYWDKHASEWKKMAYDEGFKKFPTSLVRQNVTNAEIVKKSNPNKEISVLDIGCATGDLIINLLQRGFQNVKGIDNAKGMIKKARQNLEELNTDKIPEEIFKVEDADALDTNPNYEVVTAMGLIEYLLDIEDFLNRVNQILIEGGYAFIESRNKLFNLFSANQYTLQTELEPLIKELEKMRKYSPITSDNEIEKTVKQVSREMSEIQIPEKKEKSVLEDDAPESFPFELPQYTPGKIEQLISAHGFELEQVIYYHIHPFLPRYEENFPILYNWLGYKMQPLGYTPLGMTRGSAFIAVVRKIE